MGWKESLLAFQNKTQEFQMKMEIKQEEQRRKLQEIKERNKKQS